MADRIYNCKRCGRPLEWIDTMHTCIDLDRAEFRVREIYQCNNCGKTYNIFLEGKTETITEKIMEA